MEPTSTPTDGTKLLIPDFRNNSSDNNVARISKLMFHGVAIIMGAGMYVNWMALGNYFNTNGLYSWKCALGDDAFFEGTQICHSQAEAVAKLPIYATSAAFSCAIFGGVIKDRCGGKACYLTGCMLIVAALLLIGLNECTNSATAPLFDILPIAMALWGSASEILVLGLVGIQFEFPGKEATIMTIIAATRSISLSTAGLVAGLNLPIKVFAFGYATLLAIFAILFSSSKWYSSGLKRDNGLGDMTPQSRENAQSPIRNTTLYAELSSTKFLSLLLFFSIFSMSFTYNLAVTPMMYRSHPRVSTMITYVVPLSGIVGAPIIGVVCDKLGPMAMPWFESLSLACLLIGASFPSDTLAQAAVLFSALFLYSCRNSQVYVLVCNKFPVQHHGSMIGATFLLGGLTSLMSSVLLSYAANHNKFSTVSMWLSLIVVLAICQLAVMLNRPTLRMSKDISPGNLSPLIQTNYASLLPKSRPEV